VILLPFLAALLLGVLIGRALPRRASLPTAPCPAGSLPSQRHAGIEVRRNRTEDGGVEVDEVVTGPLSSLHLEVCSQPYADDPPSERYAQVSLVGYTVDGDRRVQVMLSSDAPMRVIVLDPCEVACRETR
jgi:hypothetical protein